MIELNFNNYKELAVPGSTIIYRNKGDCSGNIATIIKDPVFSDGIRVGGCSVKYILETFDMVYIKK
jgi:hypothetical protein